MTAAISTIATSPTPSAAGLTGCPSVPRWNTACPSPGRRCAWAEKRLAPLAAEDLCGFIFKSRSPSFGMAAVKVYNDSGMAVKKGVGIFAGALMKRFPLLPVEEDGRLNYPLLRENFIKRIFIYRRWREVERNGGGVKELAAFHADHKLLILSHSPRHLTAPGRRKLPALRETYFGLLMEALKLTATVRKQTNVLQHMAGYFKKRLSANEKRELGEVIERYHQGFLPLIVPVTLIAHYVRLYEEPYLQRQVYLHLHPLELMLRNHA